MAEYKLSYTGKEIDSKLSEVENISIDVNTLKDKCKFIQISDTEPTDDDVLFWINTSE